MTNKANTVPRPGASALLVGQGARSCSSKATNKALVSVNQATNKAPSNQAPATLTSKAFDAAGWKSVQCVTPR